MMLVRKDGLGVSAPRSALGVMLEHGALKWAKRTLSETLKITVLSPQLCPGAVRGYNRKAFECETVFGRVVCSSAHAGP